jgi:hypothetical protein
VASGSNHCQAIHNLKYLCPMGATFSFFFPASCFICGRRASSLFCARIKPVSTDSTDLPRWSMLHMTLVRGFTRSSSYNFYKNLRCSGESNCYGFCRGFRPLQPRRHCMDTGLHGPGMDHDTRSRLFLLWSAATQKCAVHDLPGYDDHCGGFIPSACIFPITL